MSLLVNAKGGIVQCDLGKLSPNGLFVRKGYMTPPPSVLLNALGDLQAQHELSDSKVSEYVASAFGKHPKLAKRGYAFPGLGCDLLFPSETTHTAGNHGCDSCDKTNDISRGREEEFPRLHFGTILTSNQVIKDTVERDRFRDESKAICVEMEAAGVINVIPWLVIRGICDYADTHKNDMWHKYAALTAAAFAKELLSL